MTLVQLDANSEDEHLAAPTRALGSFQPIAAPENLAHSLWKQRAAGRPGKTRLALLRWCRRTNPNGKCETSILILDLREPDIFRYDSVVVPPPVVESRLPLGGVQDRAFMRSGETRFETSNPGLSKNAGRC
jgi:hypothetical protein